MVMENAIGDAIDFFHMDALSPAVPLRTNLYVQLTVIASSLYRLLGQRVGQGLETAKCATIFRKLVRSSATLEICNDSIIVRFRRRANNPLLLNANYGELRQRIPWLENRKLLFHLP